MWNDIDEFAQWYKDNRHPFKPQARDPLYATHWSTSVVIFRKERYQVELFYMKPNAIIPSVPSPGVEHRTLFLHGDIKGVKNNEIVFDSMPFAKEKNADGSSVLYNTIFQNNNSNINYFVIGDQGASLMSIQKWDLDLEMTSIGKIRGFLKT